MLQILYGPKQYIGKLLENYGTGNQGFALHVLRRVRVIVRSIARALTWHACAFGPRKCNYGGVVSGCPLFRGKIVLKSSVGSRDFVRCPESRSVRFSEAAYV